MENKYDLTALLETEDSSSLTSLLNKIEASKVKANSPVKVNLAYPINKIDTAFMVIIKFSANPESLVILEKELRVLSGLIRYALLKEDERIANKSKVKKSSKIEKSDRTSQSKSTSKKDSDILTNKAIEEKIEEIMN